MLRQNKNIRETLVQKCQTCLMDTTEVVHTNGSQERSFRSDKRSNTSVTRKNGQINTGPMSTLGGGERSSSREQMCQCKNSKLTGPYIYRHNFDSSAVSNGSSRTGVIGQRVPTPQDVLTFSAKGGNSTYNSHELGIETQPSRDPPSKQIGGGQSIQTMMARSPQLIHRLAAEHEQYFNNVTAHASFDNSQN